MLNICRETYGDFLGAGVRRGGFVNPVVVIGNKVDVTGARRRSVRATDINAWRNEKAFTYYDYSAKSNYNFEKPFLHLMRRLTGRGDLKITDHEALSPPEL